MSAKTGDKKKETHKKLIGTCGHEVKPVKFYGKGVMRRWCEKCNDYREQVK
jgi:hypothetical protein